MPIYDALYDFDHHVKHVLVRHEQGAVHAAQGYARVSGKVGVCFATSGPGATNLITGIADAMIDSTPIVCITGQVTSGLLGTDAFQESDVIGISMPVTKWNFQITSPDEIPEAIAKAFYIAATGRPGPVLIDITKDAQFGKLNFCTKSVPKSALMFLNFQPIKKHLKKAADLINEAQNHTLSMARASCFQERKRAFELYRKNRHTGSIYPARYFGPSERSSAEHGNAWHAWKLRSKY